MDISLSTELIDIYRDEIAERSRRLAQGARTLSDSTPPRTEISELIRDAHTIKGSSRVVGLPEMGHAAAFVEHVWKRLESGDLLPTARMSEELWSGLRVLGRREGATLFMTVLAGLSLWWRRQTGERAVALGTPVSGRLHW